MSNEAEHYVVKAEPCPFDTTGCGATPRRPCRNGCLGNGRRAVLDDAIPVEPIGTHPNGESFVWLRRPADGATGAEKYLAGRLRDPEYLATYLSEVES